MTGQDVRELLPLYALGVLDADESSAVERAVAADPTLAAELDSYRDTAHALIAAVPEVAPSPDVKARLLASIDAAQRSALLRAPAEPARATGGGPFERFAARVGKMFDVTADRARELLGLVERAASWNTPLPGIGLVHFDGGPACASADCGFVRVAPGCTFPWHKHRREEYSIVLAGTLRDQDGKTLRAGDELFQPAGSAHELTAVGDEDVIFAACAFDGIELSTKP